MCLSSAACHSLALLSAALTLSVWLSLLADPSLRGWTVRLLLLGPHHLNFDTRV